MAVQNPVQASNSPAEVRPNSGQSDVDDERVEGDDEEPEHRHNQRRPRSAGGKLVHRSAFRTSGGRNGAGSLHNRNAHPLGCPAYSTPLTCSSQSTLLPSSIFVIAISLIRLVLVA